MNIGKRKRLWTLVTASVMITAGSMKTFASEQDITPTEPTEPESLSVDLPTLQEDEESPFDFMIDPQNLIYETDAFIYGGGVVEKGANLLFHNRAEGEYDYSGSSDKLTVTNRSATPVKITISAGIRDADGMRFVQDEDFPEDASRCVYLALVDDAGNEEPLSADGEASICVELPGVLEEGETDVAEEEENTYSFGLAGDCSTDAGWGDISVHPEVTVTWKVEPVPAEQDEKEEEPPSNELQEDDLGEAPADTDNADTDPADEEIADEIDAPKDVENTDSADTEGADKDAENTDGADTEGADEDAEDTDGADTESADKDAENTDGTDEDAKDTDDADPDPVDEIAPPEDVVEKDDEIEDAGDESGVE